MNNTINTGGADAGIHKKKELIRAKIANRRITISTDNSDLCIIKLQRENGVGKVNSHGEQSGG